MRKQFLIATFIFFIPLYFAMFIYFTEGSEFQLLPLIIGLIFPTIFSTYFSVRRFYLISKLSKVGVEVTAYYRELINAALGLGLIKVQFRLNGKDEECCIYDCRSGNKKYKLLIDPNNFKHYLIMGVEN